MKRIERIKSELPRTVVIGADGFIGRHLHGAYRQHLPDCLGTSYHRRAPDLAYFDLLKPEVAPLRLVETRHKAAIITAAVTKVNHCEENKQFTRKVNVEGTISLVHQLNEIKVLPIFLSSDYVFSGAKESGYTDFDPPCPNTEYGEQKAVVEKEIASTGKPYIIIRLSKVFDLEKGSNTLLDEMANRLVRGEEVLAAYDQLFCPTWIDDVVNAILEIQRYRIRGLINVCSPEAWTRYDLALAVAKTLGCNLSLVKKISLDELPAGSKRPKKINMVCLRLRNEADVHFTLMSDCLEKLKQAYQNE